MTDWFLVQADSTPDSTSTSGFGAAPTVALIAVVVTVLLAIFQISAARRKDWENDRRAAVIEANTAMGLLYDALIEISYARQNEQPVTEKLLDAHREAHAATRRAGGLLRLYGFEDDVRNDYWELREVAREYVYGERSRDRKHPELKAFNEGRRKHHDALLPFVTPLRWTQRLKRLMWGMEAS